MMKKIVAIAAMLFAAASIAAVDVNKASEAELDGVKGVGPALSKRLIEARKEAPFKDWPDLMSRVKGVKEKAATKLSAEGLTVNGQAFGAAPTPVQATKAEVKTETKTEARAEPKKAAAAGTAKPAPKP
ncbi:ComEA family DNA-binding protein [Variovorax saccharolyticus]|uniref:ComEA family DNA-binding protein n=1 Tax=Variovorax saccharolyticus TaxID=3053516 RepID=UPI0025772F33|nr:helix-hairpin-helix domain-containing protein [Variovorax sp. J31P216]